MNTIKVMCRETGKSIDGLASLRQRLVDCLQFPSGLLVGARHYGTDLMALIDKNMSPSFTMDVFMVVSQAVNDPANGLPDFKLEQVGISAAARNHLELVVSGLWAPTGETVNMEGVRIGGN